MKKVGVLFLIFLLLPIVLADISDNVEGLEEILSGGQETIAEIRERKLDNILNEKWEETLRKNRQFDQLYRLYGITSPIVDPIFKYTVGLEPSLSIKFIFALLIYITLIFFIITYRSIIPTLSEKTQRIIVIGFIIIVSFFGVSGWLSTFIIGIINLFKFWYVKLLAILILFLALTLSRRISRVLAKFSKEMKEEAEAKEAESDRDTIHTYAEELTKK